jgi:hypothetical protein
LVASGKGSKEATIMPHHWPSEPPLVRWELYVVRELTLKRVWFAEALVSSSAREVRRLIAQSRVWAERLGKPVAAWVSDKQDAFLTGIAAEFPGVPHHFCENHFLRDVAQSDWPR